MIEEELTRYGFAPDIGDERLGEAYEHCPAVQKSIIKNAVAFAYALAQTGIEPVSECRRFGHVERQVCSEPLDWAFFAVDQRRFPPTAIFSAMVQALVAKVGVLVAYIDGPVTEPLLCGFDLLSVDQLFTRDPQGALNVLAASGRGVAVDLAGTGLDFPLVLRPDPARYGVAVRLPESEYASAYAQVTAQTAPQPHSHPYIVYGGEAGDAPVVMDEKFLGCWPWDVLTPEAFRHTSVLFR